MELSELADRFAGGTLACEAVLESLARMGHCPNLLHDDNGRWALCFEGFQDLAMGNMSDAMTATYFLRPGMWQDSIRAAVLAGLRSLS